ncbi:hypothetical protein TNCV_3487821 [Trichonephila clavipes]|nr:hypothetical protein TNCV_3487821 [Trichonephila clavipes]
MERQEFCDIKTVISLQPDMEHQEGCGIKTVISSHPDMEHQEFCVIKTVKSSHPDMEHQEFCDIKLPLEKFNTPETPRFSNCGAWAPKGGNWTSKLPEAIGIHLFGAALKRDTSFRGIYQNIPEGSELVNMVANDAKLAAKNDANLALPPRFRQGRIESPL